MGSYLSIITLKVNELNAPTKIQRLVEWIEKQDPYICCLQETYLKSSDTYRLKVRGWKKIFHANGDWKWRLEWRLKGKGWEKIFHANRDQKKAGVAILISDKIDFEIKAVKRDRRTLHNDQRINPRRRYSNYKYICTQHRSTTICKANANKYEMGN